MRKKVLDGAEAEELSSASTELLDDKSMQDVVDQSELCENAPVISETGGGRLKSKLKLLKKNLQLRRKFLKQKSILS